ncbi:hypothetical protein [Streptomyces sp. HUAS ZL42]|uniref:hypothetical protein n=1 Tax=Streptomyces sp. HUAS ZL42 TaxID=3231715 RepID=UPI00345E8D17
MSTTPATVPDVTGPAAHRAVRYAKFTIGNHVLEAITAISAGAVAGAVSLIGFGIDSGIEVVAAVVVLIRLLAAIRSGEPDEAKCRRSYVTQLSVRHRSRAHARDVRRRLQARVRTRPSLRSMSPSGRRARERQA